MNSSSNINGKIQDNTELEIGSFNEDEEQFINKKQLVHIDDDTSINIDVSDDDRSKSSTLKKSYLINNMSAFNEQFPINNQLNKINEKENEANDISNSADFYNSENGLGNFPLVFSEKNKELLNKNKLNSKIDNNNLYANNNMNDEMMKCLDTKIDNNGYFFSKKNEKLIDDNNLNYITNKKVNIKNNDNNISIKDINQEEEDYNENNNQILSNQMIFQNKNSSHSIINNENKNINNQKSMNKKELMTNKNRSNNNILQTGNFSLYILGTNRNKISGSMNSNEQTFGLLQSKDFYNKYNQIEANYNDLLSQYKKLEEEYEELKNSNKSVLDLLAYWQKFYLEILEIVKINSSKNDDSVNYYMDDPYRLQLINDVKKVILISRDKAYNIFYETKNIQFNIKGKEKELNNKNILNEKNKSIDFNKKSSICQNESLNYKGKEINKMKNFKKYIDKEDDLNSLPPIRHIEKVNTGTNTMEEKPIIKEIIKEIEIIKKVPLEKFDEKNLVISSTKLNILKKKKEPKKESINKFKQLIIYSPIKLNFKKTNKVVRKFKKNIMQKIAEVQTDMTYKNINSIETLNKACSSQLLNSQREKEKMQKFYEDKIKSLNNIINENNKSKKKEKEKKEKKVNDINNEKNKIIENKEEEMNLNTSIVFLPEMIPPENTYNIFMHCVKHFKYEEDIYKKYLQEEDLFILKNFVQKMEKYLIEASLPILKNNKKNRNEKSKENKIINIENKEIKKKEKEENKKFSGSLYSKNNKSKGEKINSIYNNSSTFNKFKAAILSLKDE